MDGQGDKGEVWGMEGGKATEQRPLSQHHNSPPIPIKTIVHEETQSARGQLVSACVLLSLGRTVVGAKSKKGCQRLLHLSESYISCSENILISLT